MNTDLQDHDIILYQVLHHLSHKVDLMKEDRRRAQIQSLVALAGPKTCSEKKTKMDEKKMLDFSEAVCCGIPI